MRDSEPLFLEVRGLRYHVRRWPAAGAPKMVLLHGWMDVSASFQFLVDALSGALVALTDLPGMRRTGCCGAESCRRDPAQCSHDLDGRPGVVTTPRPSGSAGVRRTGRRTGCRRHRP